MDYDDLLASNNELFFGLSVPRNYKCRHQALCQLGKNVEGPAKKKAGSFYILDKETKKNRLHIKMCVI